MLDRFKSRRPRTGCIIASVPLALIAGCIGSMVAIAVGPHQSVDQELARRALEREIAAATELGLLPVEERTVDVHGESVEVAVTVAPGQCVAVVAAAWGYGTVESAELERASDSVALARDRDPDESLTRQVQWCASEATEVLARFAIERRQSALSDREVQVFVRHASLRGRPSSEVGGLNRGVLTADGAAAFDPSLVLAAADRLAAGRTRLGPDVPIGDFRAVLVPEDAPLYAELVTRARNGTTDQPRPMIEPLPTAVPAAWRPLALGPEPTPAAALLGTLGPGTESPAALYLGSSAYRVLAVVDPSRLGSPCVTVQLVRMLYGFQAPVVRLSAASDGALEEERNVRWERVCAAPGPRVYVTNASDRAAYVLRLFGG